MNTPTPEETLAYEQHMLTTAIRSVNDLLSKQLPQAKSREYYDVMLQVLIAMDETITRMEKLAASKTPPDDSTAQKSE